MAYFKSRKRGHFSHPDLGRLHGELSSLSAFVISTIPIIFSANVNGRFMRILLKICWHTWIIHLLLFKTLVSLDSIHCQMKFLCLGLICKVEACLVTLCKHNKSTLNQPKTSALMNMLHAATLSKGDGFSIELQHVKNIKQLVLHLQEKCGRMCDLRCTWMGCTIPAPTVIWHAVIKERWGKDQ